MKKITIDFGKLTRQGSDIDSLLEAIQIVQGLDPQYTWGYPSTRPGAQALLDACEDIRERYACNEIIDERPWAVRELLKNYSAQEILSRVKIALVKAADFVEENYLYQNPKWEGDIQYARKIAKAIC